MAPTPELTEAQVKAIRRRVRNGARQTDLADEFGVNRRTIHRRLHDLECAETERAERVASEHRRKQAMREKRKLRECDNAKAPPPASGPSRSAQPSTRTSVARQPDPYHVFLDTPKNLSGRALAHAQGHVRLSNPEGTVSKWVEVKTPTPC